jgi:hypothetical protein
LEDVVRQAAPTEAAVTTAEKAADLGMTPSAYRAHRHRAAVEAIRAAAQGLYADAGIRVMAALDSEPDNRADTSADKNGSTIENPQPSKGEQPDSQPDTVTDPDPLRERYAAAIRKAAYRATGGSLDIATDAEDPVTAAVLAVRDDELQRLRAQLAEARGQVERVRKAVAERRTEVAEYEAENEPSAWSDAVSVTCARIEDALRVFPESGGIPVPDADPPRPDDR